MMTDEEWAAAKDKMVADCPLIFRKSPPPTEGQKRRRGFYFEIGRGWYEPVRKACLALERIAENMDAPDPDGDGLDLRPRALQIKEKFGGLRFYLNGSAPGADEIVQIAEEECAKICEKCGAPGQRRDDLGWVTTLCDTHYDGAKKEKHKE